MKRVVCCSVLMLIVQVNAMVLLDQGLVNLRMRLTDIAKKLLEIQPTVQPPQPPGPRPTFVSGKKLNPVYAKLATGGDARLEMGLVQVAGTYDLVVYGPKLVDSLPQNFIEGKKLTFPLEKAPEIQWSQDGKIVKEGAKDSFLLIRGKEFEQNQRQALQVRAEIENRFDKMENLEKERADLGSNIQDNLKSERVIDFAKKINEFAKNVVSIFEAVDLDELRDSIILNQLRNFVNEAFSLVGRTYSEIEKLKKQYEIQFAALTPVQKAGKTTKGKTAYKIDQIIRTYKLAMNELLSKNQLDELANKIEKINIKKLSTLEEFYDAYTKGTVSLSFWWKEPEAPKESIVSGPDDQSEKKENWKNIEEILLEKFSDYKHIKLENRKDFMNKTIEGKRLSDILSGYVKSVAFKDRLPTLVQWNQYITASNYTWPKYVEKSVGN